MTFALDSIQGRRRKSFFNPIFASYIITVLFRLEFTHPVHVYNSMN